MNWNHGQQEIIFHWRINCLSSYVKLGTGVGTGAGTQDLDNQCSRRHRNRGNTNDNHISRTASRPSRSCLYLKGAIPPPRANIVPQASVCFPLSVRGHFCWKNKFLRAEFMPMVQRDFPGQLWRCHVHYFQGLGRVPWELAWIVFSGWKTVCSGSARKARAHSWSNLLSVVLDLFLFSILWR